MLVVHVKSLKSSKHVEMMNSFMTIVVSHPKPLYDFNVQNWILYQNRGLRTPIFKWYMTCF